MAVARTAIRMDGHAVLVCRELWLRLKSMGNRENSTFLDYLASSTSATVIASALRSADRSLADRCSGSPCYGRRPCTTSNYGVPLRHVLPKQAADDSRCASKDAVGSARHPDAETGRGARIGEPPVADGCNAVLNALANAVGATSSGELRSWQRRFSRCSRPDIRGRAADRPHLRISRVVGRQNLIATVHGELLNS